jgi:hypothetical protein
LEHTWNELRAARTHDNWVLLYVTNLVRGLDLRILRFDQLGSQVTDDDLDAVGWDVRWGALSHDVIEVNIDDAMGSSPRDTRS